MAARPCYSVPILRIGGRLLDDSEDFPIVLDIDKPVQRALMNEGLSRVGELVASYDISPDDS